MTGSSAVSDGLPDDLEIGEEFKSAFQLMENTSESIFITGNAGTGKSTLLKYFKSRTKKKAVVLAPTGVAAVNVGGQTVHSFLKFPHRIIHKDVIRKLRNREIFENLDTVIIDEVSMVRADIMDGIDHSLRINRGQHKKPFGGVQMIFFGDLFQLSPVVERDAKAALEEMYKSPYFFSARVFDDFRLRYVELSKIYRQVDDKFVALLNRIRNREVLEDDIDLLNTRVAQEVSVRRTSAGQDRTVSLTTTNLLASSINSLHMARLPGRTYTYEAEISGRFDESAYPTEGSLKLKAGSQVMLIKNDPGKHWVNGTIARIAELTADSVFVDIDGKRHEVPRVKWQKIEYDYNKEEDKIDENVVGDFKQFPVKPAWAITIHKSQGQTFDKVELDLGGGAFCHGQLYVALSRCTNMEGITLRRPVREEDIVFDSRIYECRELFSELL